MISWPYLTFVTRGWSSLLLNATCAWIGSIVPIVSVLLFIKSRQYTNGCCLLSAHFISFARKLLSVACFQWLPCGFYFGLKLWAFCHLLSTPPRILFPSPLSPPPPLPHSPTI